MKIEILYFASPFDEGESIDLYFASPFDEGESIDLYFASPLEGEVAAAAAGEGYSDLKKALTYKVEFI